MRDPRLLYPEHSFDPEGELPAHADDLVRDLELDVLFAAMSRGDDFIGGIVRRVLLTGPEDAGTVRYRQDVLRDCLANPRVVRELFDLCDEAARVGRRTPLGLLALSTPTSVLSSSAYLLSALLDALERMHRLATASAGDFVSRGLSEVLETFLEEYDADRLDTMRDHLRRLEWDVGFHLSARLGAGSVGTDYALQAGVRRGRSRWERKIREWFRRLLGLEPSSFSFYVHRRDEASGEALEEVIRRGIGPVANTLARAAERILHTFRALRTELAFYVGCLNLADRLEAIDEPFCLPEVGERGEVGWTAAGLYDVCLSLTIGGGVVGNDLDGEGVDLVLITGANQGGKTTFLRSVGAAELMAGCGLFVPATAYSTAIRAGVFTHFRREEDADMQSGKLEEELTRMDAIIESLQPGSLVLCNESFATTNELEGSEIARQVVSGLLRGGVAVFFVTHLYEFARTFCGTTEERVLCLRAERMDDGRRTFRMIEGAPQETSFGEDLYRRILGSDAPHPGV